MLVYYLVVDDDDRDGDVSFYQMSKPHSLYKVLPKFVDNLPISLTAFLCKDFRCPLNNDTNFHRLDCIIENCKNSSKITEIPHCFM